MGFYLYSGYADMTWIMSNCQPWCAVIGGRGVGKTFGGLRYILDHYHEQKVLYLRRTQTEIDTILSDVTNPFKALMRDDPGRWDIRPEKHGRQMGAFWNWISDDESELVGYCAALSTFANIRGVDFSDVAIILYDEFIPEKRARPIKDEFLALTNLYETVNRNRELSGEPPVKMFMMANSNDIANPIFMGLGIVNKIGQMMEKKIFNYVDPSRALQVIMLHDSPISQKKQNTVLYRLTGTQSEFSAMALANLFKLDTSRIVSRSLQEYRPIVRVGELCCYKHKSRPEWYINCKPSGTPKGDVYTTSDADLERFVGKYAYLYIRYMQNNLLFEDAASMVLFEKIFK